MDKKLICFDLDNTLIKSNKAHVRAFEMAFAKNKMKKINAKKIESLLNGRHAHDVVKMLFPKLNEDQVEKIVQDHHYFIRFTAKYAKRIGGVVSTLKGIKKHYKIALVSNCIHNEISILLKSIGIRRNIFDYIVGKEDVKHSKPYPDEILKAEHLAKLKADFMVGDSIYDVIAAKKARVKSISVLTGIAKAKELMKYRPDYIMNDVNEIINLLNKIH